MIGIGTCLGFFSCFVSEGGGVRVLPDDFSETFPESALGDSDFLGFCCRT